MSIEGGASASSPKTAAAENHGIKARAKSGAEAEASPDGGFLALLTSLASPASNADAPADAADADADADADAPVVDPAAVLPQNLPRELALLLVQAGEGGADKSAALSTGPALRGRSGAALSALGAGSEQLDLALAASAAAAEHLTPGLDPLLEQGGASVAARTSKSGNAWLQSGAGASLLEARTLQLSPLLDLAARDAARSETLLSSALGESFLRQAERAGAKSSAPAGRSAIEGLWGQQALPGASRADAPATLANASLPLLEAKVADTVSYWVTQGVQNAALKLDGLGGEPVEVNISLKGREAHIGFRTDQPEIRQMLEGALVHLKDLLANQGLLLSGVSVGTSGQDGKGTPERQPRPGAQPGRSATPDAGPGDSHQRVAQPVGRAVDIFV